MSEALRFNSDKPMMSYFMRSFPKMAEAVARVKEMGAIKYNDGNWRLGNKPDKEYWDSAFRHLDYIFGGEFYDSDTGCLHIAHAVWNLCALLELNYPDLPARDEAIWANRAVHWAEEKRKREEAKESVEQGVMSPEEYQKSMEKLEDTQLHQKGDPVRVAIDPSQDYTDAVHYATCPAQQDGEEPTSEFQGSLERFVAAMDSLAAKVSDSLFAECPMCGRRVASIRASQGLECSVCGEIFDVPIGPETSENDAEDVSRFMSYGNARRGGEWKNGREITVEIEWETRIIIDECPKCGFDYSWNITCGRECAFCGEIFDVPIVPENADGPETVRFGTKGERRPVFVNTMAELFETSTVPEDAIMLTGNASEEIRFVIKDGPRCHSLIELMDKYFYAPLGREAKEDDWKVDCPKCNYTLALEGACGMESDSNIKCRGVYGLECCRCGEMFEVPIGPETPALDDQMFCGHNGFPAELFPERPGTPPSPLAREVNVECLECGAQFAELREDGLCECECGKLFGVIDKPLEDK